MGTPFTIRFVLHAGEVLVAFSQPIEVMTFAPQSARDMAANLIALAEQAERAMAPSSQALTSDGAVKH
jgi:hypothetical protein